MFKPRKNIRDLASVKFIKSAYKDHPSMQRLNTFKEQLKQQKLAEKAFCQAMKDKKSVRESE